MPRKIPQSLKGYRRDFIDFYGNHTAGPFSELREGLQNRGYFLLITNEHENVTENLPSSLRNDTPYTIFETIVFTKNPDLVGLGPRALHPLSSLSEIHYWRAFFHNSKTSIPRMRRR